MKIYAIPGMGADKRVFHKIQLPHGYECIPLDWIDPLPQESLDDYAERMLAQIDTSQPFALMGLSMGGMIASSFATKHPPAFLILISSIPNAQFLPPYFSWFGKIGIHHIVPISFLKWMSRIKRMWLYESNEDKELLLDMIKNSSPQFLRWSMQAVLKWKGACPEIPLIHIHGKQDWILPAYFIKQKPILIDGGHAMILSSSDMIQEKLKEFLAESDPK